MFHDARHFLDQGDADISVEQVFSVCQHTHHVSTSRTISGPCRSSRAISVASLLPPKSPLNLFRAASNLSLAIFFTSVSVRVIELLRSVMSSNFTSLLSPRNIPQYGAVAGEGFLNVVPFIFLTCLVYGGKITHFLAKNSLLGVAIFKIVTPKCPKPSKLSHLSHNCHTRDTPVAHRHLLRRDVDMVARAPSISSATTPGQLPWLSSRCYSSNKTVICTITGGESDKTQHFRPPFCTFNAQTARNSQTYCNFAAEITHKYVFNMSLEERKTRMAENRAINSKKPARSAFVKWARAHKGAFIINDPELKAQITTYID